MMNALAIVETCASIAPWIIDRANIFELANHPDFSVRSSAASICMEIARSSRRVASPSIFWSVCHAMTRIGMFKRQQMQRSRQVPMQFLGFYVSFWIA